MSDQQWYWCMTHETTEQGPVCRAADRMGPYPTEEAARDWQASHDSREDEWDEQDEEWDS